MIRDRVLIIPDTHSPYEDKRAWKLMIKAAEFLKPTIILILGDFADCFCISDHDKDPNRMNKLDWEMGEAHKLLKQLTTLGAKRIIYCSGNHEYRLIRYLRNKCPELYNLISIPQLLKLKELGIEWVEYKDFIQVGKLFATHDCGTAGKLAHYSALDIFQRNVVTGHTHRIGYATQGTADGKSHVTAMFGWLGSKEASKDYMYRIKYMKDWALGFGIGYLTDDSVHLVPVPIVNYTLTLQGRLIK